MFFYILVFLIIVIIEILLLSTLKIGIKNLKLSTEKYNGRFFNDDYKITISLWGLRKIRFLNLEITKEKLEKLKVKEKIQANLMKKDFEKFQNINIKTLKEAKKYAPKLDYINLIANIGTEDAIVTSYIVAIVASFLGILLEKQKLNYKKIKYIINPVYINKNLLNLELNCIFKAKMIHIIYIIYILNKKRRDDKDVRTSNRKSYGYSYE